MPGRWRSPELHARCWARDGGPALENARVGVDYAATTGLPENGIASSPENWQAIQKREPYKALRTLISMVVYTSSSAELSFEPVATGARHESWSYAAIAARRPSQSSPKRAL